MLAMCLKAGLLSQPDHLTAARPTTAAGPGCTLLAGLPKHVLLSRQPWLASGLPWVTQGQTSCSSRGQQHAIHPATVHDIRLACC